MEKRGLIIFSILALLATSIFLLPIGKSEQEQALEYNIELNVVGNKIQSLHEISFPKSVDLILEMKLPADSEKIRAYIDEKEVEPIISDSPLKDKKQAKIMLSGSRNLKVEFETAELLEITSEKYYFIADLESPINAEKLRIKLILPKYAILDKQGSASAFPNPSSISTDGQHIIIEWSKYNVKETESTALFVTFREKASILTFFTILLIIAAIAAFVIVLLKLQNKERPFYLMDAEKSVVESLREAKGELWQKQIQLKTGFSKAKLSRILRNLEVRGILKRIPLGNTNKIKLIIK